MAVKSFIGLARRIVKLLNQFGMDRPAVVEELLRHLTVGESG
jgi:hypothetical protein